MSDYNPPNLAPQDNDFELDLLRKICAILESGAIGAPTAVQIAELDMSSLPTSNPGGGKLWLNGGVLQVGS